MCLFIETIKVQNKELKNIEYHNLRYNKTLKDFWGINNFIDLKKNVNIPGDIDNSIYKCRIVYSDIIRKIEFLPYKMKQVSSLTVLNDNNVEYNYKYHDRTCFEKLLKNIDTDDILIVKNNFITDTSFSNIAFFDGLKWLTPFNPLLYGTKLALLIKNQIVYPEELLISDLKYFNKAKLFNSMLDFEESTPVLVKNFKFL
jgi:4-amino-4-deoxychorismate lyase